MGLRAALKPGAWSGHVTFIFGGAGFIGNHLVLRLLTDESLERIVVFHNFTSSKRSHLDEVSAEQSPRNNEGGLEGHRRAGFRALCWDANVPYRLMRTDATRPFFNRIPARFNLANVGLAVLLKRNLALRHRYVRIHFRERYGGEPRVKLSLFERKAFELHRDVRATPHGGA
jgi:hypothetical protein